MTSPVARPPFAVLTTRQITAVSVGVAVVLIALKAFALGASGSVSILASLADSGLDLIASLATFYAVRWAARPNDTTHRHGHGKAEAMAALVQAGLVFASAAFIGWEALTRIFDPYPVSGGSWAVGVVLISIALTGGLVWLQTRALKASGSMAVSADRAHYAADLASSVVVLIGVVSGAWLGAPGLDAALERGQRAAIGKIVSRGMKNRITETRGATLGPAQRHASTDHGRFGVGSPRSICDQGFRDRHL